MNKPKLEIKTLKNLFDEYEEVEQLGHTWDCKDSEDYLNSVTLRKEN
jgi:hypothetical protein